MRTTDAAIRAVSQRLRLLAVKPWGPAGGGCTVLGWNLLDGWLASFYPLSFEGLRVIGSRWVTSFS